MFSGGEAGEDWKSDGGIGGGAAGSGMVGGRGGEGGKGQRLASVRSCSGAARMLPCWPPTDEDGPCSGLEVIAAAEATSIASQLFSRCLLRTRAAPRGAPYSHQ